MKFPPQPLGTAVPSRTHTLMNLALVAVALGYVAYVVASHMSELSSADFSITASAVAGFVLFATASITLSTLYHITLVASLTPGSVDHTRLGAAYAVGQIVRYLPGKVMGLLYQASYLRGQVGAGTIALALLIQMLSAYAWASALSVAILASSWLRTLLPLVLLIPAAALLWQAQRADWAQRVLRVLPYVGRFFGEADHQSNRSKATLLTLLLLTNWLPFLAGWVWLLHDVQSFSGAMVFAAAYLAAAVLSTAIVFVPSGIVVREAIFLWVGSHYGMPATQLLFYGVLARLALTAADLLNAALFIGVQAMWQRRNRHQ